MHAFYRGGQVGQADAKGNRLSGDYLELSKCEVS